MAGRAHRLQVGGLWLVAGVGSICPAWLTNWSAWPPFCVTLLVLIMAVGGCSGSTAGGMKAIRVYLPSRNAAHEIFRLIHPRAVKPLLLGDRVLSERVRVGILGFFFVYMATVAVGTLLIALHQVPMGHAFGSVFSCVNATGAFPGAAGTTQFYADLPATAKTTLTVLMLLGRLELFTVLVLLSLAFWRSWPSEKVGGPRTRGRNTLFPRKSYRISKRRRAQATVGRTVLMRTKGWGS
jgi:Trk-type K+ transport system membrane component